MLVDCASCHQSKRLARLEDRAARRMLHRFGRVSLVCERCMREIEDRMRAEQARTGPVSTTGAWRGL